MAAKTIAQKSLCSCSFIRLEGSKSTILSKFQRLPGYSQRVFHTSPQKCNRFAKNQNVSPYLQSGNYKGKILRPLLFTFTVGTASFAGASIYQYEKLRYEMQHPHPLPFWNPNNNFGKEIGFRDKINKWWNRLTDGHKVVAGIIAVNVGVFLCWRIPGCRYFLTKWFTSHAGAGRSLPMLLSCFSHAEFWHLGCNMVVLWSFAPVIVDILGVEQFLAFYTTGGVVSSLASHFYKNLLRSSSFSLGASGAILAVLAAVCVERPEARLSVIFLPFFTFSASSALLGIIALDFTGLVLRWQLFDHAAHLGGSLFGIWYSKYGQSCIWDQRKAFMRWWHELRKGSE